MRTCFNDWVTETLEKRHQPEQHVLALWNKWAHLRVSLQGVQPQSKLFSVM